MNIKQVGAPILRQVAAHISSEHFSTGLVANTIAQMKGVLNGIKAI